MAGRAGCAHTSDLPSPEPQPGSETCLRCLETGQRPVQLRMCLSCGTVGCCDSSPGRHATEHAQQSGHPVMRTIEPGESWRWCYLHQSLV
ncbi:UBP-type zinc finger domain-containing protein [Streptacidiphilus sp. 4-A2]|nr:UBP-type zinc finger domain-containing protein [Streptacidiphilus sp. 4-A2]